MYTFVSEFAIPVDKLYFLWFLIIDSYVSQPKATGEQKTKPTQASIRELRGQGLSPDLVSPISLFHLHCLVYKSCCLSILFVYTLLCFAREV